jgi:hypothetical protein
MPTIAAPKPKTAATPAAPKAAPAPAEPERKVVYPDLVVNGVAVPAESTFLDLATVKEVLGWESESEYVARMKAESPQINEAAVKYGEDYLLRDERGEKVRCWNNARNRPFDETHCRKLVQDQLNGAWAFNLETIVVSRTGVVTSGQHRLVAKVLAEQLREIQYVLWEKKWPPGTEIPFQSLIAFGGSDDPKVIQTIDNVKPRSESDVIYTSEIFEKLPTLDRRECSRMLAAAIDLLWRRTRAGEMVTTEKYQTHSASLGFFHRHEVKLLRCVKHLWEENKARAISFLRLSAGQCAALMFLAASSSSDIDDYRNADPAPNERKLKWDRWDQAEEFFSLLGTAVDFQVVRDALAGLTDVETGGGGRTTEKHCILARAWEAYLGGGNIAADDLTLSYGKNADGNTVLTEWPDFGGIDQGPSRKDVEPEPTPAEVEAEKRRMRAEAAKDMRTRREEGEVKAPPKVTYGKDGKPPAPLLLDAPLHKAEANEPSAVKAPSKPRPAPKPKASGKNVNAEQTKKARENAKK